MVELSLTDGTNPFEYFSPWRLLPRSIPGLLRVYSCKITLSMNIRGLESALTHPQLYFTRPAVVLALQLEFSLCLQTPELTSNMVSPFLSLAVELQCDIIGRLVGSEDLKAVCLLSKHVAAIVAPFLYHDIVLDGDTAPIGRLTTTVKSLSESKNFGFARTLTIRNVVQDLVDAMGLLLP